MVSHVTPIKMLLREALDAGPGILYRLHLDLASLSIAEFYPDGRRRSDWSTRPGIWVRDRECPGSGPIVEWLASHALAIGSALLAAFFAAVGIVVRQRAIQRRPPPGGRARS